MTTELLLGRSDNTEKVATQAIRVLLIPIERLGNLNLRRRFEDDLPPQSRRPSACAIWARLSQYSWSGLASCLEPLDCLARADDEDAFIAAQGQQVALVARGDEIGLAGQCSGQHMIVIRIGGHDARHGLR